VQSAVGKRIIKLMKIKLQLVFKELLMIINPTILKDSISKEGARFQLQKEILVSLSVCGASKDF